MVTAPALIVMVRFRSTLSMQEVTRVMEERAPEFRALDGLRQKYYVHDPATGEIGGVYLWESAEAFDSYARSELRATIGASYQTEGDPHVEVLEVLMALRV